MLGGSDLSKFWSAFEARVGQLASAFLRWLRYVLGLQRSEEEKVAALPRPSLLDLAADAEAILAFEVREGCLVDVDTKLEGLRRTILDWQTPYQGTIHEDEALDRLWVSLL